MNKIEYKNYLKSDHWKKFSRIIKSKVGECQRCGKNSKLNVHHTNYECMGNETENDVLVLCKSCHNLEHFGKTFVKCPAPKKRHGNINHNKGWKKKVRAYQKLQLAEIKPSKNN